ncbi:MAG: radical SAM protein [Acidobacteria bacterium]|nr:radical SAM protein [Acidobacteriota bacterium]
MLTRKEPALPLEVAMESVVDFLDRLTAQKLLYWDDQTPPPILETTSLDRLEEVWLNLTNRCNLRCITCFKDAGPAYKSELSTQELVDLIDQIPSLVTGRVILSGGEPLLREDVDLILEALAKRNLEIFIITNGTLIDRSRAERLARLPHLVVQVSLDGSCPEVNDGIRGSGSFERALAGARNLAELGVDVRIYPTVTKLNIEDLPQLQRLYKTLRQDDRRFAFARFHPTGRGARHFRELYIPPGEFLKRIARMKLDGTRKPDDGTARRAFKDFIPRRVIYGVRKVNCGLGSGTLSIDADGTVYPCHWLHDRQFAAGDLRRNTLAEIYFASTPLRRFRDLRVDGQITACTNCDVRYLCGGGCRARALAFTGDIAGLDPECELMQTAFRRGLWCAPMWELDDDHREEVQA